MADSPADPSSSPPLRPPFRPVGRPPFDSLSVGLLQEALADLREARREVLELTREVVGLSKKVVGVFEAAYGGGEGGVPGDGERADVHSLTPPLEGGTTNYPTLYPDIEFDEYVEEPGKWPLGTETTTSTPPPVGSQQVPVHVTTPDGRVERADGTALFRSGEGLSPPTGGVE